MEDCGECGGGGESECQDEPFATVDGCSAPFDVFVSNSQWYMSLPIGREAAAGETGRAGKRRVCIEAETGNRAEGVVRPHPAESPLNHSLPVPVPDDVLLCYCVVQNEKTLAKACEKARTEKKKLQEELNKSQTELSKLREQLAELEAKLQSTKLE